MRLGAEPEEARQLPAGMVATFTAVFDPSLVVESSLQNIHAVIDPASRLIDAIVRLVMPAIFSRSRGEARRAD